MKKCPNGKMTRRERSVSLINEDYNYRRIRSNEIMALNFSEKCLWAKKVAMLDLDSDEGESMFYKIARENGISLRQLSYYYNAYEAAGESGIRALSYKKRISGKILKEAMKKINRYLYNSVPPHLQNEIGFFIKARDNRITISETRPVHNSRISKRSHIPSFQVRYTQFDKRWHLYWMRKFNKWWPYRPQKPIYTIADCIRAVETDTHGCFWG